MHAFDANAARLATGSERGGNADDTHSFYILKRLLLYFMSTPLGSPVGLQFLLLHVALHAKQAGLQPSADGRHGGRLGTPTFV